jgi:hypothetical protein
MIRQDQNLFRPRKKKGLRNAILVLILLLAVGAALPHLNARMLPGPRQERADALLVLTGDETDPRRAARGAREAGN